jgi:hypothetical protein
MKKLIAIFAIVLLTSCLGYGQMLSKTDIFGGYSYTRVNPNNAPALNTSGWEASLDYRLTHRLAVVADFGGMYCCSMQSIHTFMGGAQLSQHTFLGTVSVHGLAGGAHGADATRSDTAAAWAAGAALDHHIKANLWWRVVQADYLGTNFLGGTQANYRFTTGVLLRMGKQ